MKQFAELLTSELELAFEKAGNTAAELIRCAKQLGVPVEIRVEAEEALEGLYREFGSVIREGGVNRAW